MGDFRRPGRPAAALPRASSKFQYSVVLFPFPEGLAVFYCPFTIFFTVHHSPPLPAATLHCTGTLLLRSSSRWIRGSVSPSPPEERQPPFIYVNHSLPADQSPQGLQQRGQLVRRRLFRRRNKRQTHVPETRLHIDTIVPDLIQLRKQVNPLRLPDAVKNGQHDAEKLSLFRLTPQRKAF